MSIDKSVTRDETVREVERRGDVGSAGGEVLVVNNDPEVRLLLHKGLFVGNFSSTFVSGSGEVAACLERDRVAAVVVCVDTPASLEILEHVRSERADLPILAFARVATPELVRDVMRAGADDFVFGTFDGKSLVSRLRDVLRRHGDGEDGPAASDADEGRRDRRPGADPSAESAGRTGGADKANDSEAHPVDLICRNPKMLRVLGIAKKIASTDSTVLVEGESGTGKEIIARWIHDRSHRAQKAFVDVNCGALPENLLESQLFGHEKGSFTGAVHRQLGLFEVADGGTIFLDEIGEMGLDMQVKLLRVLQSREFRRIGGSQVVKVNVRVIAATNRDLKEEVEKGRFRTDLYYRLNVISLEIPPLRERREEIPLLIDHFSERFASEKGLPRRGFSTEAVEALQKLPWEGNIRELENTVERLILLCQGETVEPTDIDENVEGHADVALDSPFAPNLTLDEVKRLHIARVLRENNGNKMRSARILKINVKTLYNLIRNLEITY